MLRRPKMQSLMALLLPRLVLGFLRDRTDLREMIDSTRDPHMAIEMADDLRMVTEMVVAEVMVAIDQRMVETEVMVAEVVDRSIAALHELHTVNPRHCLLAQISTLETFCSTLLPVTLRESLGIMELSRRHSLLLMLED
jgi:hypothetical protein